MCRVSTCQGKRVIIPAYMSRHKKCVEKKKKKEEEEDVDLNKGKPIEIKEEKVGAQSQNKCE
eukprot:m.57210 g.57210  ORF g.57210 m.57210 type:complete len:62 (+) comp11593_c0_seq1:148-333(+)